MKIRIVYCRKMSRGKIRTVETMAGSVLFVCSIKFPCARMIEHQISAPQQGKHQPHGNLTTPDAFPASTTTTTPVTNTVLYFYLRVNPQAPGALVSSIQSSLDCKPERKFSDGRQELFWAGYDHDIQYTLLKVFQCCI
jgi:hypothetical protein